MVCCTRYCAAETHFDRKVAERDLRRYRRRGPDATTRFMLAELRRRSLEGRKLLDVGGSIGVISAELAGTDVAGVTGRGGVARLSGGRATRGRTTVRVTSHQIHPRRLRTDRGDSARR
jgi:hypothetical protein